MFLLIGFVLACGFGSWVLSQMFSGIARIPFQTRWVFFSALPVFGIVSGFSPFLVGYFVITLCFLGASMAVLLRRNLSSKSFTHKVMIFGGFGLGTLGLVAGIIGLVLNGFEQKNIPLEESFATRLVEEIPDPSQRGSYLTEMCSYGSGQDKHRIVFGDSVAIQTEPVDGTAFLDGWDGLSGRHRTYYWGHDYRALPLNGRVWYPKGKGPFPLVLIVHGNHVMEDYSDDGYGYLADLMASKGYIVASVDENFLNSSWADLFGGLKKESDARAWILLEHLRLWHSWNREEAHLFYGKIDTQRIGLIGHSRGGEAVGHAAVFNRLPAYPDDGSIRFDYGFHIQSVLAIAPVDGQYQPANIRSSMENVDYFVLHGAQDADVTSFEGLRQYERLSFTDSGYHFKAGLYIAGANHGQFNQSWGENDREPLFGSLLNLRPLLTAKDQEQIAKVFVSAFLEASLKEKKSYLPVFQDARAARSFLPKTLYLNQFEDSRFKEIAGFEEDLDLKSTIQGDSMIKGEHLTVWKEATIDTKHSDRDSRAVYLGWHRDKQQTDTANYAVQIQPESLSLDTQTVLVFSMAWVDGSTNPKQKGKWLQETEEKDQSSQESSNDDSEEEEEFIDFHLEIEDLAGEKIRFPLHHDSPLLPPVEVNLSKADAIRNKDESESVIRFFSFPLHNHLQQNPHFDPTKIQNIHFVFDLSEKGLILLDQIGFMSENQSN